MDEAIFLGLRSNGIDMNKFQQHFGKDLRTSYASLIQSLMKDGLALLEQNRLRLTSKGYLLCDEICQMFR
jgi:oxygen-independent coproporphyrinogen-3 oxidase